MYVCMITYICHVYNIIMTYRTLSEYPHYIRNWIAVHSNGTCIDIGAEVNLHSFDKGTTTEQLA